jgi:hypothetical protein
MRLFSHPLQLRTPQHRSVSTSSWALSKSSADLFDAIQFDETRLADDKVNVKDLEFAKEQYVIMLLITLS